MKNLYKRATTMFVGCFLIVCGIAGLFLPIVPGAPLLLAGVFIIFSDCERLRRVTGAFRIRFPRLPHFLERFTALENIWRSRCGNHSRDSNRKAALESALQARNLDFGGNKHETANARTSGGDIRDVRQAQGIDL